MAKTIKKTAARKPKTPPIVRPEYAGQEGITKAMEQVGKLTYEQRQDFNRRWADVFNRELSARSQNNDFDAGEYY